MKSAMFSFKSDRLQDHQLVTIVVPGEDTHASVEQMIEHPFFLQVDPGQARVHGEVDAPFVLVVQPKENCISNFEMNIQKVTSF